MARHTIMPGECVASLAARCGTTVEAIWDDPDNAELRQTRQSPYMLAPGDQIALPEPADQSDGPSVEQAGSHNLQTQTATVRLKLKLLDERWGDDTVRGSYETTESGSRSRSPEPVDPPETEPLGSVAYRLEIGGRTIEGTTDGDGVLDEAIDARATVAQLTLEPGSDHERTIEIRIGYLDPAEEQSGVMQRLSNLGFRPRGDADLPNAIAAFQRSRGLDESGELDDATRERLVQDSGD